MEVTNGLMSESLDVYRKESELPDTHKLNGEHLQSLFSV
jgi:hypothetical protein